MAISNHKQIYKTIISLLDYNTLSRTDTINKATEILNQKSPCASNDGECVGAMTELRGRIGSVLYEMEESGVIKYGANGYSLVSSKPVLMRAEACEREIIKLLNSETLDKAGIRRTLEDKFGTKKTLSLRDDNVLHSLISQQLKRLSSIGIIKEKNGLYSINEHAAARLDDIDAMLALKEDFLTRIHSKGGEFFEHFFMTLLARYLRNDGKTVISNKVSGGTADGGIDGVIETVDKLGFKEKTMVQMKNRIETTNETTVRGFYGAVCAYRGTRGIFATTSDFHPAAKVFLDGIDNCVGVDGSLIFEMAKECGYGITKKSGKYTIDTKII